ncbi:hypothetical protein UA42_06210 [Photobacterium kishitanii]|nr:hypothetical protein UA42_06210 [Photobacterium kishitanii]
MPLKLTLLIRFLIPTSLNSLINFCPLVFIHSRTQPTQSSNIGGIGGGDYIVCESLLNHARDIEDGLGKGDLMRDRYIRINDKFEFVYSSM